MQKKLQHGALITVTTVVIAMLLGKIDAPVLDSSVKQAKNGNIFF